MASIQSMHMYFWVMCAGCARIQEVLVPFGRHLGEVMEAAGITLSYPDEEGCCHAVKCLQCERWSTVQTGGPGEGPRHA